MDQLNKNLDKYEKALKTASEESKPSYQKLIDKTMAAIIKLTDQIGCTVSVKAEEPKSFESGDFNKKSIQNDVSKLPEFFGKNIQETEKFISKLDQLFDLLVQKVDMKYENIFLNNVFRRLSESVYKTMNSSKSDVSTYANFKKFIKAHYAGQLNAFQCVSRIFDIHYNSEAKFHIYASKLTEEVRNAKGAIEAHFKDVNKEGSDLSADQVLDFFGALIFSEELKKSHFHIFKDMTLDFDKLKDCYAVATNAEYFRERLSGNPVNENSFFSRNKKIEKNEVNTNRTPRVKKGNSKPVSDNRGPDKNI